MDVKSYPIWENCPFKAQVPEGLEVRLTTTALGKTAIFWSAARQAHVAILVDRVVKNDKLSDETLEHLKSRLT